MILRVVVVAVLLTLAAGVPVPYPYPSPQGCCMPSPTCSNPCAPPPPPPPQQPCCMPSPTCSNPCAPPPPPQQPCCMPSPTCSNPCQGAAPMPFQKSPRQPVVYAPLPGEIVFKLQQNWDAEFLESSSSAFQILEGNVRSAVQAVLGPMTQVTNIYFREGYVPGNPPSRPKTVAHMMVNGGSDAASILEHSLTPDASLGDGLKVYKDSFNAY